MSCNCFIVPQDVLRRLASDPELSDEVRRGLTYTAALSEQMRLVRTQVASLSLTAMQLVSPTPKVKPPLPKKHVLPISNVDDCHHGTTLPGTPVANPGTSADGGRSSDPSPRRRRSPSSTGTSSSATPLMPIT